jgi:hypothetical protein
MDIESQAIDIETLSMGIESHPIDIESLSMGIESHAIDIESLSMGIESHPIDIESFSMGIESHPIDIESFSMDIDSHPIDIESLSMGIESHSIDIETFSMDIERHPIDIESHSIDIESLSMGIESHAIDIESLSIGIESHPIDIESLSMGIESHPIDIESLSMDIEGHAIDPAGLLQPQCRRPSLLDSPALPEGRHHDGAGAVYRWVCYSAVRGDDREGSVAPRPVMRLLAPWHLVPGSAAERPPRLFLVPAAPLLEEKRNPRTSTLIPHVDRPIRIHGTSLGTRLASNNHPVDAFEIEVAQRPEQWLQREELDHRFRRPKVINARKVRVTLDADTHPDIGRPFQPLGEPGETRGPFRQHLKPVPACAAHNVENALDVGERYSLVEQVAH